MSKAPFTPERMAFLIRNQRPGFRLAFLMESTSRIEYRLMQRKSDRFGPAGKFAVYLCFRVETRDFFVKWTSRYASDVVLTEGKLLDALISLLSDEQKADNVLAAIAAIRRRA